MVTFRGKLCEGSCLNGHFLSQLCNRFTNPATTKIDEDLELRYPHKGMFKELLKNEGSQNYGLIVLSSRSNPSTCFKIHPAVIVSVLLAAGVYCIEPCSCQECNNKIVS
ncbi:uncharacterized protein LOC123891019 isoform X2 [Trifolium pratense]|uniref:uncharacterized protein LOC123891019 isoform X2 n=1 Tax=Trifolium pratense TaxID=57577 RepID=UPI001E6901A9|nr:uncharacterized protein LOC123891019 isoform X2 [Trifolium pratense]XP_045796755.1 uncharacterized protein LOC123891019 isoform X2 [Trifolium pratense]